MTATAETADYPIQTATAQGGNPFYSLPTITTKLLPEGVNGTYQTLDAMAQCVRGEVAPDFCGYQDEVIRKLAEYLVRDRDQSDSQGEIKAVFNYVVREIEYLAHPINAQTVQDACRTLQFKSGDCVSLSVLLATLLASLNYPVQFVAQYTSEDTGYSHVYLETQDENGNEIALDAVAKDKPIGWRQSLKDGAFETTWEIF